MNFNIYKNTKDVRGVTASLEKIVARLHSGENGLKTKTAKCRELAATDKDKYRDYKSTQLPGIIFSGAMDGKGRDISCAVSHNLHIVYDIDNTDPNELSELRTRLEAHESCVLSFQSPSGQGAKFVFKVEGPIPVTDEAETKNAHLTAFQTVAKLLDIADILDKSGKDINRLCLLAYDPTAHYNPNATPLAWKHAVKKEKPPETEKSGGNSKYHAYRFDLKLLEFLSADDFTQWIKVGLVCHNEGIDINVWEEWSKHSSKYKAGECQKRWKTFGGRDEPVRWATLVRDAKQHGYVPPERQYFIKNTFLPAMMADQLMEEYDILKIRTEKELLVQAGGVYTKYKDLFLTRAIRRKLGTGFKPSYAKNTIETLNADCEYPGDLDEFPYAHPAHINCLNGIYNIKTHVFKTHDEMPEFKSLIQIPVNYDPDADCEEIERFLDDVLQSKGEDMKLAYEIIGYTLLQATPIAKMVVLLGPTHTGKSTFLDIVRALLGSDNVSNIGLQQLEDDSIRFARSGLYGKLANMSSDLSSKALTGDSNVKKITAGDPISAERKGVDQFTMRPFAKLLCATNEMPTSRDKSDAWLERLVILPFEKQHRGGDAKRNYLEQLTTPNELSGLLNNAIIFLRRLLERGYFESTETTQAATYAYEIDNNHVKRFYIETDWHLADEYTPASDIYNDYKDWADESGIRAISKTKFIKATENHFNIKLRRLTVDGKRDRVLGIINAV